MSVELVAYTYEADYHCLDCTFARFTDGDYLEWLTGEQVVEQWIDNEGNPVHPVFDTDEYDTPLVCGTCGCVIEEAERS